MPVLAYRAQTWTFSKSTKIQNSTQSIEEMVMDIPLRDGKTKKYIKQHTQVKDEIKMVTDKSHTLRDMAKRDN